MHPRRLQLRREKPRPTAHASVGTSSRIRLTVEFSVLVTIDIGTVDMMRRSSSINEMSASTQRGRACGQKWSGGPSRASLRGSRHLLGRSGRGTGDGLDSGLSGSRNGVLTRTRHALPRRKQSIDGDRRIGSAAATIEGPNTVTGTATTAITQVLGISALESGICSEVTGGSTDTAITRVTTEWHG